MASFVAKIVGKKILGETIQNKFGKEDPYFETVPATRLDGKPDKNGKVKTKRRKKALPPGLSDHDGQVLTKVKRRAYRLDMCLFSFLGVKFGWGSVIGIIPAIGDVLDALLALMVMKTCQQVEGGLPMGLRIQMMINIIFDFVLGLVPFLGDVADAAFRANTRNVILLEDHLREKGKKTLRQSGMPVPSADPSDPDVFDRLDATQPPSRDPSRDPSRNPSTHSQQRMPTEPQAAAAGKSSRWGRQKTRPQDVEMGDVDTTSKKDKRSRRQ